MLGLWNSTRMKLEIFVYIIFRMIAHLSYEVEPTRSPFVLTIALEL
jgi:hypothetical protein